MFDSASLAHHIRLVIGRPFNKFHGQERGAKRQVEWLRSLDSNQDDNFQRVASYR